MFPPGNARPPKGTPDEKAKGEGEMTEEILPAEAPVHAGHRVVQLEGGMIECLDCRCIYRGIPYRGDRGKLLALWQVLVDGEWWCAPKDARTPELALGEAFGTRI